MLYTSLKNYRSLFLCIFLCINFNAQAFATVNPSLEFTEEEKTWLQSHSEISLATSTEYLPYYAMDENGKKFGLFSEIANLIKDEAGITIQTKIGTWIEEPLRVKRGERDGIWAGSKALSERHGFIRTRSYTHLPVTVFAHKDATFEISSLEDMKTLNVVILKGNAIAEKLLKEFPFYHSLSRSLTQKHAVLSVLDGRADIYLHDIGFSYTIKHQPDLPMKLMYITNYGYDVFMQFPKQSEMLRNIMDKTLARIGPEKIQQIISNWMSLPQDFSLGLLAAEEKQWLKNHKKIRLGFAKGYEPYVIESADGRYSGVFPELVKRMSDHLNIDVELVVEDFSTLIRMKDRGEIHGQLAMTKKSIEHFNMIQANHLGEMYPALFSHQSEQMSRNDFLNLSGKRIAVVNKTAAMAYLQENLGNNQLVASKTPKDAFKILMEGKVDYFYGPSSSNYYVVKNNLLGIRPVYINTAEKNVYYLAISSDEPVLASLLSKTFAQRLEKQVQRLTQKWTYIDPSQYNHDLSDEEQTWLAELPPLKLAVSRDLAPFEYLDENGKLAGINADYIKLLSKRLGFSIQPHFSQVRHDAYDSLISGDLDMGFMLFPSGKATENLRFSHSIFQTPMALVTKKDFSIFSELSQFKAHILAVIENSQAHRLLQDEYPLQSLLLVKDLSTAMLAIQQGKAQGVLASSEFLKYQLRQVQFNDLHITLTTAHWHHTYIAVKKELAPLLPLLEKSLKSFTPPEKQLIFEKWAGIRYAPAINWSAIIFWSSLAALIVLLFMASFIYWNRRLKTALLDAQLQRELAEQANNAKSLFLANMSHEIRTPLNAVLGFSELLQKETDQSPRQLESLNIINAAGSHLLALINDILDISKIEAGQQKCIDVDFDIHKMLTELQAMFYTRCAEKGLSLTFTDINKLPQYICGDEGKVRQMLINLLGNAIKFTDRGKIECRFMADLIQDNVFMLHIDIIDSGRGIGKAEQQQVFSSYEQTESGLNKAEGTGLGLAISRAYARMMGGDITFVSTLGKGTVFSLSFLAKEVQDMPENTPLILQGFEESVKDLAILVVDDNQNNRVLLQRILEPIGFIIYHAENGLQALDIFHDKRPDLILMDKRMPVMDGLEATVAIKKTEAGKNTPVIFISAHAFEDEQIEILANCGEGFISKPFRQDELLLLVAKCLQLTPTEINIVNDIKPENIENKNKIETAASKATVANSEAKRILIVDDNPVNRMLLNRMMEQAGYLCHEAENGEQALQLLSSWRPNIMLLDIQMPVMDGFQVLKTMSTQDKKRCPVIAATASNDANETQQILTLGASAVCDKPFNSEKLKSLVQHYLQQVTE
ncbi:MAG: transporter substrate-binding domain-containing protein [Pseudomonadales bacterium]|nr:transporter substrate-binding domain-containing protein [Pseudomonadales bacterium]